MFTQAKREVEARKRGGGGGHEGGYERERERERERFSPVVVQLKAAEVCVLGVWREGCPVPFGRWR